MNIRLVFDEEIQVSKNDILEICYDINSDRLILQINGVHIKVKNNEENDFASGSISDN